MSEQEEKPTSPKPLLPMNHPYPLDESHHLRLTARTPHERAEAAEWSALAFVRAQRRAFIPS